MMAEVTNMDTEMAESLNDAMGSMLAVQVVFRELQPGEVREDLVAQCRAGMNTECRLLENSWKSSSETQSLLAPCRFDRCRYALII